MANGKKNNGSGIGGVGSNSSRSPLAESDKTPGVDGVVNPTKKPSVIGSGVSPRPPQTVGRQEPIRSQYWNPAGPPGDLGDIEGCPAGQWLCGKNGTCVASIEQCYTIVESMPGGRRWTAENISQTQYSDGSPIYELLDPNDTESWMAAYGAFNPAFVDGGDSNIGFYYNLWAALGY